MKRLLCVFMMLLAVARPASASCAGSSPAWTSTPDSSSVSACIAAAQAGDTITVSAGSGTWSGISINKAISLIGAGAGNTVISGSFTLTGAAARISGFTFNQSGYSPLEWAVGFRIDHNAFNGIGTTFCLYAYGNASTGVEGLIDHNTFTNCKVVYYGEPYDAGLRGRYRWSEPLNMGTSKAIYVEDNTFIQNDGVWNNAVDGNLGSRMVARFNNFVSQRIEQHSLQSDNERAVRLWEIYNNAFTTGSFANYRPFFIRGGTGVIFHNTSDGGFLYNTVDIDNARSEDSNRIPSVPIFGMCTGSSYVDGNTSGQQGWPCRDQIGRSTDASLWDFSNPAPVQQSAPAYIWLNTQPSGEIPIRLNCVAADEYCTRQSTYHLLDNRDYYTYRSSFTGAAGVGEGTLANRPATCTTGVAYWATDEGSWNSLGADGVLYKCTATNTWTLYYTPYTYPHPLQGGGGTRPAAPTNVRIR